MALKSYKPTTPGQRGLVLIDRSELWKGRPVKSLTEGLTKNGGRNNTGRITMRRKGGGAKRLYRIVDFKRTKFDVPATVERIEYDPNRTAFIALIKYEDGELAYILAPQRLAVGDKVIAGAKVDVKPGNAMPFSGMPIGTIVHNVELKPGKGGQVVSMAVVVATGIAADGSREVLGLDVGDSEDETFWRSFLLSLKQRGLTGVRLVISDQHSGLVAALKRAFQGSAHQRCRVHFARNLLAHVPKSHADMVAAVFRTIFAQPDPEAASAAWDEVRDQLAATFPKIAGVMDEAKAEVLAFTAFPKPHWRKIWSTNPLERLNKEIKRRSRVVGIFPNAAAVIRLVGAVLIDTHDEWIAGDRRYLSEESMTILTETMDTGDRAAIEGGK